MERNILVVTKSFGQVKEMHPYVEEIARTGSRVVFLLPYNPDAGWLHTRLNVDQTEASIILASWDVAEHFRWEAQSRLAERAVSSIRNILQKRGVDVSVQLYAGGMKKAIKKLITKTGFELIVTPIGMMDVVTNFLTGAKSSFFGSGGLSPVIVFSLR
jgi:hypothetical protein